MNKPSINKFAILALPAFMAPSIYLSGISNSIAYLFNKKLHLKRNEIFNV